MTNSRNKGNRFEVAVVNWLRTHGFPYVERNGGGFGGPDILGVPGVAVECKDQKTLSVPAWWRQTEEQAEEGPPGTIPLLVIKRKNTTDVGEAYAVMKLSDLAPLLGDDQ